jgi:hypothetical protein
MLMARNYYIRDGIVIIPKGGVYSRRHRGLKEMSGAEAVSCRALNSALDETLHPAPLRFLTPV